MTDGIDPAAQAAQPTPSPPLVLAGVDPREQFVASRAAGANGNIDADFSRLVGSAGAPGRQSPTNGLPPVDVSLPLGLRADRAVTPDRPRWDVLGDIGRSAMDSYSAMVANVKDAFPDVNFNEDEFRRHLAEESRKSLPQAMLDRIENTPHQFLAPFKALLDAGGILASPMTGLARATLGSALSYLPGMDKKAADEIVDKAMVGLGPGKGRAGFIGAGEEGARAGAGEAAAEGAPAGATAPPEAPPVEAPAGSAESAAGAPEPPAPSSEANPAGATGEAPVAPEAPKESAADIFANIENEDELKAAGIIKEPPPPFTVNGERPDNVIELTPEVRENFRKFVAGESGDNPIQASLESLSHDETMNDAISKIATFIPRDAVKPDSVLAQAAFRLGITEDEIKAGPVGNLPDDEHILAWSALINSGAREVVDAAKAAIETPTGSPEWEKALRAYALQNQIERSWTTAGTEMGRAFRARQLVGFARSDYAKVFNDVLANVGPNDAEQIIRKLAELEPDEAAGFIGRMRRLNPSDVMKFVWYNCLLGPATIAKKLTSDAMVIGWNLAARYTAEKFGSGNIPPGETAALFYGYTGSVMDAFRAAGKAMMAGGSQFMHEFQTLEGDTVTRMEQLIGDGNAPIEPETPTNNAWTYMRAGLPTTWIGAADDFAKVMNYRAELRAGAYRHGAANRLEGDELGQHVADMMADPPDALHEQAKASMLTNVFQDPLEGLAARFHDLADALVIPVGTPTFGWGGFDIPVGRLLLPFTKVPANIMKFAYRNSPLPLVAASDGFKAELAAGGATRDLALARVGLGTALSTALTGLVLSGMITGEGPTDKDEQAAWRRAGNEPYSIKLFPGMRPLSYRSVEPLANIIAPIADTHDVIKYAKDQDAAQAAASVALGVGNALTNKTYFKSVSDFLDALHDPDQEGSSWARQLAATVAVPNTIATIDRATDEWKRAHYDLLSSIKARTPGASEGLEKLQTFWGDPIKAEDGFAPPLSGTGLARALSPVKEGAPESAGEPIDKWIWENRHSFPTDTRGRLMLPSKPGHIETFDAGPDNLAHLELTPQQYSAYVALAGNQLKGPSGLGAKDYLNALVQGGNPDTNVQAQWNRSTPVAQALIVQKVINQYRGAAKQQLMGEFPELAAAKAAAMQLYQQELSGGSR